MKERDKMTQEELKNRADVPEALTWDLTGLYPTKEAFETAVADMQSAVKQFCAAYEGNLTDAQTIQTALKEYSN